MFQVKVNAPFVIEKPFNAFNVGDFLVVRESYKVGIKLTESSIKFEDGGICRLVLPNHRYLVPRNISITLDI